MELTYTGCLRGSNGCTLCQRARQQRENDQREGRRRADPETLGHIQSARCVLQARAVTSEHHHCWQQVQREIVAASPESKGWTFPKLVGEQSIQTFWKETCRELYLRTTLTEDRAWEMTDETLKYKKIFFFLKKNIFLYFFQKKRGKKK